MALNLPFPTANPDGALRGTYSAEGAFCWSPPVAGIPINFDVHVNRLARDEKDGLAAYNDSGLPFCRHLAC